MIDISAESVIDLNEAAKSTPGRGGKRTHLSTVLRWILRGAKAPDGQRVRLEAIRLGAKWVTSHEALQRFAEALTPRLDGDLATAPRAPSKRQRASERAARELKAAGI